MDRYIEQLLEELDQLRQAASCWQLSLSEILFENISLEEEVAVAPRLPLYERLRMTPEAFPPAHLMSHSNRVSLLFALEDTLRAMGYQACYPIGTPSYARYEWLREQLSKELPILRHNTWPLHFWQHTEQSVHPTISVDDLVELPSPFQWVEQF